MPTKYDNIPEEMAGRSLSGYASKGPARGMAIYPKSRAIRKTAMAQRQTIGIHGLISILQLRRWRNGTWTVLASSLPNGYVGIDLDHVLENGQIVDPAAADIIRSVKSYTEVSPAPACILFAKAELPAGVKPPRVISRCIVPAGYFTMTGEIYQGRKPDPGMYRCDCGNAQEVYRTAGRPGTLLCLSCCRSCPCYSVGLDEIIREGLQRR